MTRFYCVDEIKLEWRKNFFSDNKKPNFIDKFYIIFIECPNNALEGRNN